MKTIAIPQSVNMQKDYENGWELDTSLIEEKKLVFDDIFGVYVKDSNDTEYISFNNDVFNELNIVGIWNSLNQFTTYGKIEDYEEGDIKEKSQLQNAYIYLKSIENFRLSNESKKTIDNIVNLVEKALKNNVGLYFFF